MSATDTSTYRTDPHGFPTTTCPRCAGHGAIPAYSNHFHGVCFTCNGAGHLPATRSIANTIGRLTDHIRQYDTNPDARLVVDQAAAKARTSYERTLRLRAGRPNGCDTDTNRLITAAREILNDRDRDDHEKALALAGLYRQRRTTTASRGVRDHIQRIHYGTGGRLSDRAPLPVMLAQIAAYLDTLTA